MKYTRNQVKSLTNPSAAIPRVPLLPLKKKKIRHHYLYIYRRYIREACQKNSSPSGDDTFADSAGIGNGARFPAYHSRFFAVPGEIAGFAGGLFTDVRLNFARPDRPTLP